MARNRVDVDLGTGDRELRWERFKDRINEATDSKALDKAVQLANERLDAIQETREQLQEIAREEGIKIRTEFKV